jgi:hypothetical protein
MAMTSASPDDARGAVPAAEPRPIFLRAYVPTGPAPKRRGGFPRPSDWVLVFDTETWPEGGQAMRIGTYQLRKQGRLRDKGIFYDPDQVSDDELAVLQYEAARHACRLMTVSEFRETVFFRAYDVDATIVGFNLPFDIARLAIAHAAARTITRRDGSKDRSMVGGFTFRLSNVKGRPNIRVRHRSSRSAFISFTQTWSNPVYVTGDDGEEESVRKPGFFLDLRTLAAALTSKSFSLARLAKHLGVASKGEFTDFGRVIDPEYVEYAVQDTEVTWQCYEALMAQYQRHQLPTPATKIFSEAGLGKAYLNAMNIRPWRTVQPDFPPEIIGAIMSSYFGGRSEVRWRREIVQTLYCDFASMYPTVCTLMDLWRFVISDGMTHEDWTAGAQAFLDEVDLAALQKPETWRSLRVLVQVKPDADILPVRARYSDGPTGDPSTTIGLNYLTSERPLWMTLADCVASKLLTGKAPEVVRAIRFGPKDVQEDLAPINVAGDEAYAIDPARDNFYKRVIDLRREVKASLKRAKAGGAPKVELDRLDAEQLALKILANATSYGIFIELNVEDADQTDPDTAYGADGPFQTQPGKIETPGSHFHPFLATQITGAARLMLAITERLLIDEGLDWVFCDTDSMAFARPEGMAEAEFQARVKRVCEWFTPLNPYEGGGSILEFEDQNLDPVTGEPRALLAYAISAKRYALFNWGEDGQPIIRKASAHGLGHLSAPYGKPDAKVEEDEDAETGVKLWQEDFWRELVLDAARGDDDGDSEFVWRPELQAPAASRYAATTTTVLGWFSVLNRGLPYDRQIRPFNFMLWFPSKKPHERAVDEDLPFDPRQRRPKPVAAYVKDLTKIGRIWDRETCEDVDPGWIRTYAEVLRTYPVHSESKFLDGVHTQRGKTRRRHIKANLVWNIGKEGDRFEEDGSLGIEDDPALPYGLSAADRAETIEVVQEAKVRFGVRRLRKAAGVSDHTIARALAPGGDVGDQVLVRLRIAAARLGEAERNEAEADAALLAQLRERAGEIGVAALAIEVGVDASNLAKMLKGDRVISKVVRNAVGRRRSTSAWRRQQVARRPVAGRIGQKRRPIPRSL